MPIVNNTIVAPFNTWTVSKFLGMGSVGDISTIVQKALVGGGLAFDANGYLLAGKRPYWNIFSEKSPGKWWAQGIGGDGVCRFGLKHHPANYDLGVFNNFADFEGYVHTTPAPSLNIEGTNFGEHTYIEANAWVDLGGFKPLVVVGNNLINKVVIKMKESGAYFEDDKGRTMNYMIAEDELSNTQQFYYMGVGKCKPKKTSYAMEVGLARVIQGDGSIPPMITDYYVIESTPQFNSNVVFRPSIYIRPEIQTNPSVKYDRENRPISVALSINLSVAYTSDLTISGNIEGLQNGMSSAAIRIESSGEFTVSIPKGQRSAFTRDYNLDIMEGSRNLSVKGRVTSNPSGLPVVNQENFIGDM